MNDILPYIAGTAGIGLIAWLFISPYTSATQRKSKAKMAAIGDAIERETITAFTRMHHNVASAKATASATTGMAEIYAAMCEIEAQTPKKDSGSPMNADHSGEDENEFSAGARTSHSTSTIDQYSPYWHDRTENPGALKF